MYWKSIFVLMVIILAACDSGITTNNTSSNTDDTPIPPTATFTPGAVEFTATALVVNSTQTADAIATDPSLATPFEAQAQSAAPLQTDCKPGEFNSFDADLSAQIQSALVGAGFEEAVVGVITTERTDDCVNKEVVRSILAVNLPVDELNNDGFLAAQAADILAALRAFPPSSMPGIEATELSLRFDRNEEQRVLESPYSAAMQAYQDGLREKDLLQALGGLQTGG